MTEKEKFEEAKRLYKTANADQKYFLEILFPELQETEDEKIRKDLIKWINEFPDTIWRGHYKKDVIAWLEKQGNPADKVEPKFKVGDTMRTLKEANDGYTDGMPVVISIDNEYYHCTNELIAIKDQDDYEFPPINVKQKSADKVEPKFKVGEFVINSYGFTMKVVDIKEESYRYIVIGDNEEKILNCTFRKMEESCHLWDISDAKNGDVLAFNNETIVIFKDLYNSSTFHSYCHIEDGEFGISEDDMPDWWNGKGFKPATKEQRDILFKAMHEAGYEWDDETKELKRLEKQGEQKETLCDKCKKAQPSHSCQDIIALGRCYIEAINTSSNKVEPKFKVGDWLCANESNNYANIIKIVKIVDVFGKKRYKVSRDYDSDLDLVEFDFIEKYYHLWTIADAKDGDVLVGSYGIFIFMNKSDGYCGVLSDNTFIRSTGNNEWTEGLHPATKEQCDLLFQKMKEAVYEWSKEAHELKKIENTRPMLSDFFNAEYERGKADAQKPKWSEEDKKMYLSIIEYTYQEIPLNNKQIAWLVSVKQRMEK